jgi:hypothetical protein
MRTQFPQFIFYLNNFLIKLINPVYTYLKLLTMQIRVKLYVIEKN